jgi:MFS transporter, DHA1 family, inner membrane transport protein
VRKHSTLLISRIMMAFPHGVFFGVGAVFAGSIVPKEKSGLAVALMIGGLTIAMVIGVPLGSRIGHGFDWRLTFLIVTAMGTIG